MKREHFMWLEQLKKLVTKLDSEGQMGRGPEKDDLSKARAKIGSGKKEKRRIRDTEAKEHKGTRPGREDVSSALRDMSAQADRGRARVNRQSLLWWRRKKIKKGKAEKKRRGPKKKKRTEQLTSRLLETHMPVRKGRPSYIFRETYALGIKKLK